MNTENFAKTLRRHVVRMSGASGASHVGSCLSLADIIAMLYGEILSIDPQNPDWPDRDRFILSKGHAAAILYAALAERGFFPVESLGDFYTNGSDLMGHVSHKVPGVELSTGSLGHGLPVAVGMAYAGKLDGRGHRVFAALSDGECDEGSIWEAAMFAAHHRLANLIAVIDYNGIQSLKTVSETLELEPFADKWKSFGWDVFEVNGHDHAALRRVLSVEVPASEKPRCVIARTIKGKGVSFMENSVLWHYRSPRGEEFDAAMKELG